jgi:hypothetical protein
MICVVSIRILQRFLGSIFSEDPPAIIVVASSQDVRPALREQVTQGSRIDVIRAEYRKPGESTEQYR